MKDRIFIALTLAAVGCANYMKVEVEGRVVDEAGRPVPNAEVTTAPWYDANESPQLRTFIRTDEEGRFNATLPRSMGGQQAVFAVLADESKGGFTSILGNKATDLRIVLQPLYPVRAEIDDSLIPIPYRRGPQVYASSAPPQDAMIANYSSRSNPRSVTFRLPPGSYNLTAIGPGKPVSKAFEVKDGEVDLGSIELEPYKFQTLFNREAPELHIADARGVSKDLKLSDLRGKWVALFFWSHHMWANTHMLPAYIDLYESREAMKDRFEIIVVHSSDDVLTVFDLERAASFKGGLKVPMPLVIDDREKTFEAYGLERGPMFRTAPSQVLINPEGKVVAHGFQVFRRLAQQLGDKKTSER